MWANFRLRFCYSSGYWPGAFGPLRVIRVIIWQSQSTCLLSKKPIIDPATWPRNVQTIAAMFELGQHRTPDTRRQNVEAFFPFLSRFSCPLFLFFFCRFQLAAAREMCYPCWDYLFIGWVLSVAGGVQKLGRFLLILLIWFVNISFVHSSEMRVQGSMAINFAHCQKFWHICCCWCWNSFNTFKIFPPAL